MVRGLRGQRANYKRDDVVYIVSCARAKPMLNKYFLLYVTLFYNVHKIEILLWYDEV